MAVNAVAGVNETTNHQMIALATGRKELIETYSLTRATSRKRVEEAKKGRLKPEVKEKTS